jgi:hypothetical protein
LRRFARQILMICLGFAPSNLEKLESTICAALLQAEFDSRISSSEASGRFESTATPNFAGCSALIGRELVFNAT